MFFHGLEQRSLRLGGRAVDLVADDHVGEDGAGTETELAARLVVDRHAGDVARKQVGRELDAAQGCVDRTGQGFGQHRLADAGHVLDEQVPAGEEHRRGHPDDVRLALDHLLDVASHSVSRRDDVDARAAAGSGGGVAVIA